MHAGNESLADVLLLDNYIQVAGAFMHSLRGFHGDERENMAYICTGMGSIAPLRRSPGSSQYRAYARLLREEGRDAVLNLVAFDCNSKRLAWSARGLRSTKVPRSSLVKALAMAGGKGEQQQEQHQQKQHRIASSLNRDTPKSSISSSNSEYDVLSGVQTVLSRSLNVPVAEITKEALLEELGTDSLIPVADFAGLSDVASLCDLILSQMQVHAENRNHQPAAEAHPHSTEQTVIDILSKTLDLESSGIDMASNIEDLGVDSLGKYLAGSGIPLSVSIYALNSPSAFDKPTARSENEMLKMQEYAAACMAEIKRRQPQGPYMVGGYSMGGTAAFEMARQLLEAGDEVDKLVLIDTACPIRPTWLSDNVVKFLFSPELNLRLMSDSLEVLKKEAAQKEARQASRDDGYDFSIGIEDQGLAEA
ncbi:uncharacterized protein BDV17DRAFT_295686 [Aspergillus undulatus]|uniref:uncharacterized protein n=1 Tax=Aspergillus undulatus TaxID=1810928 RepID=UPI003CCD890B